MENRIKECQRDLFAGRTSALRLGLLKTGAMVRRSVRRIKLAIGASASSRVRPRPCETDRRCRGLTNRTPQAAIHSDNAVRHRRRCRTVLTSPIRLPQGHSFQNVVRAAHPARQSNH